MPTPPVTLLVISEFVQGDTPSNANNLYATRRPASMANEPTIFMTRVKVEATLKKEKEKAPTSFISLDLKPPYSTEVAASLISRNKKCQIVKVR